MNQVKVQVGRADGATDAEVVAGQPTMCPICHQKQVSTWVAWRKEVPHTNQFSEIIEGISSEFAQIFNQAEQAEAHGLDELAGMGFRSTYGTSGRKGSCTRSARGEVVSTSWVSDCWSGYGNPGE